MKKVMLRVAFTLLEEIVLTLAGVDDLPMEGGDPNLWLGLFPATLTTIEVVVRFIE